MRRPRSRRRRTRLLALTVGAVVVGALALGGLAPSVGPLAQSADTPDAVPLGLLTVPTPDGNPTTAARVAFGERLFSDTRLSGDGGRSCATCHMREFAFAEPRAAAIGPDDRPHGRNTQTVLNAAYLPLLLWDGSASGLEEQALMPFLDEHEMAATVEHVLSVVESDTTYRRMSREAFGRPPDKDGIVLALAAFQRTLLAGDSPFDRYLFGGERDALTPAQKRGYEVYLETNCILCHEFFHPSVHPLGGSYALFTDGLFHNLGVGFEDGVMPDVGRYSVTQVPEDWGAFRTPTLRNVAVTAPYMHDGSMATLEEVVEFYNDGGEPNPNLDPAIVPLELTDREMRDLVAFLHALTSPEYASEAAELARARHAAREK